MDVMEFFRLSTGKWRSQRTTHHLAFRRTETGESEIYVEALEPDHPKVFEICELHEMPHQRAIGGAFVTWQGAMGWDKEDENHEGSTVFVLIPDETDPSQGSLLRERGYAEIVPIIGHYYMDEDDALVLTTDYETMSSIERFWFNGSGMRLRSSTVKRFGGFSTATFCTESRIEETVTAPSEPPSAASAHPSTTSPTLEPHFSLLGW
jgi:hypothetical protein